LILVTVGGQVAFDRLIRVVDEWAGEAGRSDVFFQVLDGQYEPTNGEWARTLTRAEFDERFQTADVIVAHAGMGTIITALETAKPVLVMPRRAALGEQRHDHHLAPAERFRERGQVHVAMDEAELRDALARIDELTAAASIGNRASDELIDAIREFVG
jgi:UDP-N-acetylglucosamine transferase subunit ALG13